MLISSKTQNIFPVRTILSEFSISQKREFLNTKSCCSIFFETIFEGSYFSVKNTAKARADDHNRHGNISIEQHFSADIQNQASFLHLYVFREPARQI